MDEYNRICPHCSHPNVRGDLQCVECGANLTFVYPSRVVKAVGETTPATNKDISDGSLPYVTSVQKSIKRTATLPRIKLVSGRDGIKISIPAGGCLLGREGDVAADYFESQSTTVVSRKHLRIFPRGGTYLVLDEGSLNRTWINKQILEYNHEYPLNIGDSLIMADLEFKVSIDE
jgi:hypothetical protein